METTNRFLKAAIRSANKSVIHMPWTRGAWRAAGIARREGLKRIRNSA